MKLYGLQKQDGSLESGWFGVPCIWPEVHVAKNRATIMGLKLVRIEVVIITPKRRATTASKEGKQMAAKPKAKKEKVVVKPAKKTAAKGKK